MKKFKVTWTEHYNCSATVEAESEVEAMAACEDANGIAGQVDQCKREFDGTSDWAAREEGT